MKKEIYNIKIEAGGEKAYDEISSFLSEISFGLEWRGINAFYSLDIKNKEAIAKLNPKKNTIELTDKSLTALII
jgi:hypothetical protein